MTPKWDKIQEVTIKITAKESEMITWLMSYYKIHSPAVLLKEFIAPALAEKYKNLQNKN